jgi:hypothetical protein
MALDDYEFRPITFQGVTASSLIGFGDCAFVAAESGVRQRSFVLDWRGARLI